VKNTEPYLTLFVNLNLTEIVNLSLKPDWLIGILFQDQQICCTW